MARWRLTAPHYLKVPGTVWRYEETDRETGEQNQVVFNVPRLLDPKDPKHCNRAGEITVAYAGSEQPGDRVFEGPPTPDMEPLDDEARALSGEWQERWQHPVESLPAQGDFAATMLRGFEKQIEALLKVGGQSVSPQTTGVSEADFRALQEQVAALMARNAELEAAPAAKTARRA